MSADLFAEFGNFPSTSAKPQQQERQQEPKPGGSSALSQHQQSLQPAYDAFAVFTQPLPAALSNTRPTQSSSQPNVDIWGDLSGLGTPRNPSPGQAAGPVSAPVQRPGEEDEWGDFESASPSALVPIPPAPPTAAPALDQQQPIRTRVVRASTIDMMNNRLVDFSSQSPQQVLAPSWAAPEQQKPERGPHSLNPVRKSTEEFFNDLPASAGLSAPKTKPAWEPADPNVLFDAEDFELSGEPEDADDFGDFEDAPEANPQPRPDTRFGELLGLDLSPDMPAATPSPSSVTNSHERTGPPPQRNLPTGALSPIRGGLSPTSPYPHVPAPPPHREKNPYPGLGLSTEPGSTPNIQRFETKREESPNSAWPAFSHTVKDDPSVSIAGNRAAKVVDDDGFDDWEAFDNLPPAKPALAASKSPAKHKPQRSQPKVTPAQEPEPSWDWDPEPDSRSVADERAPPSIPIPAPTIYSPTDSPGPPPTNIPPPSVLLPILPPLLRLPLETLLKPSTRLAGTAKTALLTHPQTINFLRAHIALATVTAHILSGRRQRWSRDRLLSSKMSISAAGSKGMKLSSVDKAESQREAREATEVVDAWKEVVGPLRAACAGTGARLRIPEISGTMAVTTVQGGLTAPKACLVCGLKREERVAKVDIDVEDSFGEWWVDHWGHRTCRNFWIRQEKELRSR